jgi:hypothetical protein
MVQYMRIRSTSAVKENVRGRHYRLKRASRTG